LPNFSIDGGNAKKKKKSKTESNNSNNNNNNNQNMNFNNNCNNPPKRNYTAPTTVREKIQCDSRAIIDFMGKAIPNVVRKTRKGELVTGHNRFNDNGIYFIVYSSNLIHYFIVLVLNTAKLQFQLTRRVVNADQSILFLDIVKQIHIWLENLLEGINKLIFSSRVYLLDKFSVCYAEVVKKGGEQSLKDRIILYYFDNFYDLLFTGCTHDYYDLVYYLITYLSLNPLV
jgi:hypothetical protein